MNTEKTFELIAMITQLRLLYSEDAEHLNNKMLKLISDLEDKLIKEVASGDEMGYQLLDTTFTGVTAHYLC